MNNLVTKSELCKLLGKDGKTVLAWMKQGMPVANQAKRGKASSYDVGKVVDWLVAKAGSKSEMDAARIRLMLAQAEKAELDVEQQRGNLIPLDDMTKMWGDVISAFRAKILALPDRLTSRVINMNDPKKVRKLLMEYCKEALNEMAEFEPEKNKKADSSRQRSNKTGSRTA